VHSEHAQPPSAHQGTVSLPCAVREEEEEEEEEDDDKTSDGEVDEAIFGVRSRKLKTSERARCQ